MGGGQAGAAGESHLHHSLPTAGPPHTGLEDRQGDTLELPASLCRPCLPLHHRRLLGHLGNQASYSYNFTPLASIKNLNAESINKILYILMRNIK